MIRHILTLAAFAIPALTQAQSGWPPTPDHLTLNVWPSAPPDAVPTNGPEADISTAKDNLIASRPVVRLGNVSTPTITLYTPKGANTGAAVVVFPGGGYNILAIDLEGTEVCDWLNGIGVNCILVKYRVPDTGPYNTKSPAALEDAQRAVGLVRTHAADSQSCRPDFAIIIYPGYLADASQSFLDKLDLHPTANTPPTFLVQAEDDPVHVENATTWFLALKAVKVPAELHLFAKGGHGYGLRLTIDPVTTWPDFAAKWLQAIHILRSN